MMNQLSEVRIVPVGVIRMEGSEVDSMLISTTELDPQLWICM